MRISASLPALLTAALLAVSAGAAEPARAEIDRVEVGFHGNYRAGGWTPLTVTLKPTDALPDALVVETETTDAEGSTAVRTSEPVPIARNASPPVVRTIFQAGRLGSDLTVRLKTPDGNLVAERRLRSESEPLPKALAKGATLWVTAGPFEGANEPGDVGLDLPAEVTAGALAGDLPTDPLAYAPADALFIRGDLAPAPEQAEAIRRWVAGGGHLVVTLGRFTDAFRAGPFAAWSPVEVGGTVQLFNLAKIEEFSGSDRSLPRRARVVAAQFGEHAEAVVSEPGRTFVARGPYGFGRVTLFAFDLDVSPFSTWEGLPPLLRRALAEGDDQASDRRSTTAGLTDLATQLTRADETFEGLHRPTSGTALLYLLLYAAVVGPLDYVLVHRVLLRPALTWLTLPLIVAGAALWLNAAAVRANGTTSAANQLDLVDLDAASGTLRGRSTVTLYAADSTRAGLAVSPAPSWGVGTEADPPRLGWTAPPEATFGGTYREASGGLFRPGYSFLPPGDQAAAESIPLLVWASRRFETTWQRDEAAAVVESNLVSRGRGRLEGTITHRLPGPLKIDLVAFGNRAFEPREPEWHPGEPIDLGSDAFTRRDLDALLKGRAEHEVKTKPGAGGSEYIVTTTAYDPLATNLDDVVRMLTFHESAGGRAYTGLANDPRRSDDLTPLLRLGRAVLIGRLEAPASEVTVTADGGETFTPDRRTTYVRLVLPVTRAESEAPTTLPPLRPSAATERPSPLEPG